MNATANRRSAIVAPIVLGITFGVASAIIGWWSVPVIALAYGAIARDVRRPGTVAAAMAMVAWLGVLAWLALRGAPVWVTASTIGGVMGVPSAAFLVITLAFVALLAGPAAVLGGFIASRRVVR